MDWEIFFEVGLAVIFVQGLLALFRSNSDARLSQLERKIDLIMQNLGIEYTPQVIHKAVSSASLPEIQQLIIDGKKIQAIKLYREMTGLGLKEAKDMVDTMQRDLGV